ncbi:hypothetical protein AN958_10502 [Leucoagaricus sp. SymC.cos]|nr:hypothetical protein AN958_10502 [Leucoagaricus sp. SymC.cos]
MAAQLPSAPLGPTPLALDEFAGLNANFEMVKVSLARILDYMHQVHDAKMSPSPDFMNPKDALISESMFDAVSAFFPPPKVSENVTMHEPTAPPVEIQSPQVTAQASAPPPPSVLASVPENALAGPSGSTQIGCSICQCEHMIRVPLIPPSSISDEGLVDISVSALANPSAGLPEKVSSLNTSLTSLAVGLVIAAQGHVLPFDDSPTMPTLASTLCDLSLCDALQRPPPTHGTANSAAPAPSLPVCDPPSEATACPPPAPKPAPPPWPAQSTKHPPPPSSVKHSYTDTVRDMTSLVNLAKTVPNLPSDCIIMMHQASVLPAASKRKVKSTIPGPSRQQVLIKIDPLPSSSQFPALVGAANCSLSKSDLQVDSCHFAYGGISLLTSRVASQGKIDLVKAGVSHLLSLAEGGVEAALPHSQSYLKVMDIPFFKVDGQQVTMSDV